MKSTLLPKVVLWISYLLFIIFLFSDYSFAQGTPARFIGLGGMWTYYESGQSGGWEDNYGYPQGWFRVKVVNNELRYIPCGMARKWGATIGVQNWTDPQGTSHPYYICSPASNDMTMAVGVGGSAIYVKKIVKYPSPQINVNGHPLTYPPKSWNLFDVIPGSITVDSVNPNLPADEEVISQYNYYCGITTTVTVYAYWDSDYGRVLVFHYNFKNTGNTDSNPNIELPGQTLNGVVFNWGYWPHVSWEGGIEYGQIWQDVNQNDDWWDYYGSTYKDYVGTGTPTHPNGNSSADSLRVQMWWDGSNVGDASVGDPELPLLQQNGFYEKNPYVGQFLSSQYVGYGILYAQKSATDTTNDFNEPTTTTWVAYANRPNIPPFKPAAHQAWYNIIGSGVHTMSPQDSGYTTPGEHGAIYGYTSLGPYYMPFNSEINVTMVVGIYGMSYEDQIKYGNEYASGQMNDAQKNFLLAQGRDSLLATIGKYTRRYFTSIDNNKNPYSIPATPPSPDINVTSKQKSIMVSWSDVSNIPNSSTGVVDFKDYKLYRASGNAHMLLFNPIWEGTSTSYEDTAVQSGVPYYYAVTAVNNGSQNWDVAGESLESSQFANRTTAYPAVLLMNASASLPAGKDTVKTTDTVNFSGQVWGGLPPYHYTWTSSIDGLISDSLSFKKDSLSAGSHTIYFTVTDSLGTVYRDSVLIVVRSITGISDKSSNLPKEFALNQNYPNPFNPTTQIQYSIPKESKVVLEIYNILGQKIKTLISEVEKPGYYNVMWGSTNQEEKSVPSGVYIYRLSAYPSNNLSPFIVSKKMTLIK